jgi:hypothetical protein
MPAWQPGNLVASDPLRTGQLTHLRGGHTLTPAQATTRSRVNHAQRLGGQYPTPVGRGDRPPASAPTSATILLTQLLRNSNKSALN